MFDPKGKVAFITGGGSGLGLSMARAFGKAGMKVVLADIDERALAAAKADLEGRQVTASTVLCDVTDRASMKTAALKALADFGKVHVVCNNAGVAVGGPWDAIREREWDWIIDVNLKGVVYGFETFVPLIRSHGEGGHIVNTASMAGMISPPNLEPYCATKFAVVGLTKSMALDHADQQVRINCICPARVETPFVSA